MTNPVKTAFPQTGTGERQKVVDLLQQRSCFIAFNVAEVAGNDFTNHRLIHVLTSNRFYQFDAASLDEHDGLKTLVDTAGNHFTLVPIADGINFIETLTETEYEALPSPDPETLYVVKPDA